jgi:hypothetical protein
MPTEYCDACQRGIHTHHQGSDCKTTWQGKDGYTTQCNCIYDGTILTGAMTESLVPVTLPSPPCPTTPHDATQGNRDPIVPMAALGFGIFREMTDPNPIERESVKYREKQPVPITLTSTTLSWGYQPREGAGFGRAPRLPLPTHPPEGS